MGNNMPANSNEMSLVVRAGAFEDLMRRSEFTNARGDKIDLEAGISQAMKILGDARERGNTVFVIGNGGSAGIAAHATTDFVNVCKLRAQTMHDSSILTCMANDYGYENAFARMLSTFARKSDVLVAISSSGKSQNIRNAAAAVTQAGGTVITLSGFEATNPLRTLGELNIWLDSRDYGLVEIGHQFILHNIADRFGREKRV